MSILNQSIKFNAQLLILVALLCGFKDSCSQEKQIKFTRVDGANGIALGKINSITQDPQGFIWFADQNNNALIRFDGYKMKSYRNDPFNDNSIGPAYPETILADSKGIIWIGLLGMGLDRLDPATDSFIHYRHRPGDPRSLSNDTVLVIFRDSQQRLWIGTNGGLNLFDERTGTFTRYMHLANDPTSLSYDIVRAITEDRNGTIWVGTGFAWENNDKGGLNRLNMKTGNFTRYMADPKDPKSLVDNKVRAIYEDSRGNLWVGTRKNGLHKMNRQTGEFTRYPNARVLPAALSSPALKTNNKFDHISFITEDSQGALWIGTVYSGINRYDPVTGKMDQPSETSGFTDSSGWCAYSSRDGMLWLSTQENHLFRIDPAHITIPLYPGIVPNCFYQENDILWMGSSFGLVAKDLETQEIIHLFVNDPLNPLSLGGDEVTAIRKEPGGGFWLGTFHAGLNFFDSVKRTFIQYRNDPRDSHSIGSNNISKLVQGRDGSLWIGTWKDGLDQMNPQSGTFKHYRNIPGDTTSLSENIISAIWEDKKQRLWIGTGRNGLNLMVPGTQQFKHYLHGLKVTCIYEDMKGIIWTGTSENLYRFDEWNNVFVAFKDPQSNMPYTGVMSILEDDSSNLWLSVAQGLVRLNRRRDHSITYGDKHGLHEGNVHLDAAFKGPGNHLFFRDVSGYYAFSPDKLESIGQPPALILTELSINGKPVAPDHNAPYQTSLNEANEIKLTYRQNSFSIEFAAIDFKNPEDNIHLFKLEGYDDDWRNAGSDHTAHYYNVRPQDYTFRVKAANSDGAWIEKSIQITITPPWWTLAWFRVTAVICMTALLYVLIRWRVQHKFRLQLERSAKEKQLAEIRQERAELLQQATELQMQSLRAQMNPHFIFNSLNSINRFILQNNKLQASEYLSKFSKLVRMILQNSQAAMIPLESELEALTLYLELETLRFEHHFSYSIAIPSDFDTEILRVPPLIIQPFVENAIWHGLMHKEEKGRIEIELSQEASKLFIKIKDDGIGRKRAKELASKSTTRHKSLGLKITADRISMINRNNEKVPVVTINDLVHEDGSAAGTEVVIALPVITQ